MFFLYLQFRNLCFVNFVDIFIPYRNVYFRNKITFLIDYFAFCVMIILYEYVPPGTQTC